MPGSYAPASTSGSSFRTERPPPAAWKMNMLVLLMLYPVVFLFGTWVQTPLLMGKAGLPFWLALFIGNVVSVLLLSWLVPALSSGFRWWLAPAREVGGRTSLAGAALVLTLYIILLFLFSKL
jgi:antibiotic biosynthesis monooxygenase (ABM) superfamily enzyme